MKNILYISGLMLLCYSCNEVTQPKNVAPIILGDSTTIVTETDSQYLKNVIDDIEPSKNQPIAKTNDTIQAQKNDTLLQLKSTTENITSTANNVKTNSNDFVLNLKNNTQIVFKDIATKEFKTQDPSTQNDLSYLITKGDINKSAITVNNGSITEVLYKSKIVYKVKTSQAELVLSTLAGKSANWTKLPIKSNVVTLGNINSPAAVKITAKEIQTAIEKAISKKKYKSSVREKLRKELAGVNSLNHKLISYGTDYQQFRISGKDAKGVTFKKIIRLDQ